MEKRIPNGKYSFVVDKNYIKYLHIGFILIILALLVSMLTFAI